jgi:predicted PurR-regulated permease PerM
VTIVRRNTSLLGPFLLVGATVLVLYFAREILIPLALALTLNFLLYPLVNQLQKLRLARVPAVVVVMVFFLAGAGSMAWIVAKQLVAVADNLPDYRLNLRSKMDVLRIPTQGPVGRAIDSLTEVVSDLSTSQSAQSAPTAPVREPRATRSRTSRPRQTEEPAKVQIVSPPVGDLRYLRSVFMPLARPFGTAVIVLVFTVFMLIEREDLRNRVLLLGGISRISLMTQALEDASGRISGYLGTQFVVNAGFGLLFGTGLYLLGLPNSTLWGVLAAILRWIPYVGTLTAVTFPFFLSIAVFQSWGPTVIVIVLFGVLELAIGNFVEPYVCSNRTGISPLAILVSAMFWTLIWGWPGLVLSTPLTVCAIVLGRYVPQMSFLQVLLGHQAELSPAAGLYQRLLATDQRGARGIAERFLKDRQLVELYDHLFIPCLSLAEEDRHRGMLDETKSAFVWATLTELIAEFGEDAVTSQPEAAEEPGDGLRFVRPGTMPTVISMATEDVADELTATMLAQVLEQSGYKTLTLPFRFQSREALEAFSGDPAVLVCISALPPFAFTQARTLYRNLRQRVPHDRVFLGIWGAPEEGDRLRASLGKINPEHICATIASVVARVGERSRNSRRTVAPIETVSNA